LQKQRLERVADLYFAYPITPQSELIEYMAKMMPKVGGTFVQSESEIAAINMVYGAAGTGKKSYDLIIKPRNKFENGRDFLPCRNRATMRDFERSQRRARV